jgi:hypothetical protein
LTKAKGKRGLSRLREEVLEKHGLRKGKQGHLRPKIGRALIGPKQRRSRHKTALMAALELAFDADIDDLLDLDDSLQVVASKLGLDQSTVSRWRLRRGMREGEDRLVPEHGAPYVTPDGEGLEYTFIIPV